MIKDDELKEFRAHLKKIGEINIGEMRCGMSIRNAIRLNKLYTIWKESKKEND